MSLLRSGGSDDRTYSGSKRELTIEKALEEIPLGPFHTRLFILCGLGFMADAMEIGLLSFLAICAGAEWNLTNAEVASISSVVFAGELVGGFFWGPLADSIGRRPAFMACCIVIACAGILSGAAPSLSILLLLRGLVGVGVGGLTVPFDLLAEFLPSTVRGSYLLIIEVFWTTGSLFVAGVAWAILGSTSWRALAYATAVPVAISCIFSAVYLSESPRWLLEQGRLAEAEKVLKEAGEYNGTPLQDFRLVEDPDKDDKEEKLETSDAENLRVKLYAKTPTSPPGESASLSARPVDMDRLLLSSTSTGVASPQVSISNAVGENAAKMLDSAAQEAQESTKRKTASAYELFLELINTPKARRISIAVWTIWFSYGLAYYGFILLLTRIYQNNDDDTDDGFVCDFDYQSIFVNSAFEIPATMIAIFTVDRIGRVALQFDCYATASVTVLLVGLLNGKTAPMLVGFICRMSLFAGSCTTWVHLSELYNTRNRATAHGVANVVARVGALLSPYIVDSDVSLETVGIIMSVFTALAALAVTMLPETVGVGLDGNKLADSSGKPQLSEPYPNVFQRFFLRT
jgi:MFS family permease